ncbi:MAG: hypothetical protein PWQ31_169 [Eubacteriales bacterium]|nr:hypothetical protein [Eubacteriales bacterium]
MTNIRLTDMAERLTTFVTSISLFLLGAGLMVVFAKGAAGRKLLSAGLLLLILSPVLRVGETGILFWRQKDRKYALISLLVLFMMIAGYASGVVAK